MHNQYNPVEIGTAVGDAIVAAMAEKEKAEHVAVLEPETPVEAAAVIPETTIDATTIMSETPAAPKIEMNAAATTKAEHTCLIVMQTKNVKPGCRTVSAMEHQEGTIIIGPRITEARHDEPTLIRKSEVRFWKLDPFKLDKGKISKHGALHEVSSLYFVCPECGHTARVSYSELNNHGLRIDKNSPTGPLNCRECNRLCERLGHGKLVPMLRLRTKLRMLPNPDEPTVQALFSSLDDPNIKPVVVAWAEVEALKSLILPRIWAVYPFGALPTDIKGWDPQDTEAELIAQKEYNQYRCSIRPINIAMQARTGMVCHILMEGKESPQIGIIDEAELSETTKQGFKRRFIGSKQKSRRLRKEFAV